MCRNRRDGRGRAPGCAAVGGTECQKSAFVGVVNRHDYGSIRLNQRLSANACGTVGCPQAWTPGETAVRRFAHVNTVTIAIGIPLGVTVAIEGTGRSIVTGDPVLVRALLVRAGDEDGITPRQTAIRAPAGIDASGCRSRRAGSTDQGQRGDHPDVMPGIIRHNWVADTIKRAPTGRSVIR